MIENLRNFLFGGLSKNIIYQGLMYSETLPNHECMDYVVRTCKACYYAIKL